jgi:hypothetical protein
MQVLQMGKARSESIAGHPNTSDHREKPAQDPGLVAAAPLHAHLVLAQPRGQAITGAQELLEVT